MKTKFPRPVAIIAVQDVRKTSKLLTAIFGWKSGHGGSEFDVLMGGDNKPTLMLHEFHAHEHNRFRGIHKKSRGVGQALYVFDKNIEKIYKSVRRRKLKIVEPLFFNENSEAREFTFQIAEGYQFSVCKTDEWLYYWV